MSYDSDIYTAFLNDKLGFFDKYDKGEFGSITDPKKTYELKKVKKLAADQISDSDKKKKTYDFLYNNKFLIEQEFKQIFADLEKEKNKEAYLFYCYYCALLLKNYYAAYGDTIKEKVFLKASEKIKQIHTGKIKGYDSFLRYLKKAIEEGFFDFIDTPLHTSKIRNKVAFANVCRIYWMFLRNSVTKFLVLSKDWRWLDKVANAFHTKIDVDKVVAFLEKPNAFFRVLSLAFFGARFLINAAMVIKHTFFPSAVEENQERLKRFLNELYKRHCEFLNDFVWFTVNLFTNYSYLFKALFNISAGTANWITVGFLGFDFALLLWKQKLAYSEYRLKKEQYNYEINLISDTSENALKRAMLEKQLQVNEISYQAKKSNLIFNSVAALMLVAGFSASLLFTLPALILGSYLFCLIGVAMYLSDDAFEAYREKSLTLAAMPANSDKTEAKEAYRQARKEFILTFSQNALMPGFFILTCAFCWQAALALVVVYAAYKLTESLIGAYNNYQKQKPLEAKPEEQEILLSY